MVFPSRAPMTPYPAPAVSFQPAHPRWDLLSPCSQCANCDQRGSHGPQVTQHIGNSPGLPPSSLDCRRLALSRVPEEPFGGPSIMSISGCLMDPSPYSGLKTFLSQRRDKRLFSIVYRSKRGEGSRKMPLGVLLPSLPPGPQPPGLGCHHQPSRAWARPCETRAEPSPGPTRGMSG